ncbi:MAG: murein biosynthesis integral membrane protein MurJ [Verrucomicrobiae bacterium]|nr:murein biosynthesis integral membrane protein MurJ [Verrucomicrobiae bacterium]
MSQMLKSSGAMAAATMTSRVLGLVREVVYASFMGTGPVASAFKLAFMIPNLFRRLLGEGALTAAFIPIFKHKEVQEGDTEMWRAANAVVSGLFAAAGVISVLVVLGLSGALWVGKFSTETTLMLELLRLMFPYMLLVCLAAVFIGMANARGHFFVPALGSVMLNAVMIASVLVTYLPQFKDLPLEQRIFGLAIGVLIAGFVQMIFQLPSLHHEGYRFRWVTPWRDPTVREVVKKMIPGSIGVAAFQINVLVTQAYVFFVDGTKTINATFDVAVRLMEFPQGVFGISLATFLLPTLSGLAAAKKYPEFRATLNQGLNYISFSNLIAAAVAFAVAEPIVRLLFEHGKFGPDATRRVALTLQCFAPGLVLFSMNNILARAFFALNDIKTPMKVSVFCLVLNLSFAVALVHPFREAGLAVANTCSAVINTGLLLYALRRKLARLDLIGLNRNVSILFAAAVISGLLAYGVFRWWDAAFGHQALVPRLGGALLPIGVAGAAYWALALSAKVPAASEVTQLLLRKFKR